jgi:hypothetical protein
MKLFSWAANAILGRPIRLPHDLDDALVPPGVNVRVGRLLPALGGFFARMGGSAAAVTLRRTIVVHPDVRLTRRLLAHEVAHVRQWDEDRFFPLRYTVETIRRGYRQNRYEQQARDAEKA